MLKGFDFPRHHRIRERQDFQHIFQKGKRLQGAFFTLYYCPNDLECARIGVITSKRNLRKAVRRNQVKRVVREAFRQQQSDLKRDDILVVAQRKANDITQKDLRQCLEQLFTKLRK